MKYLKLFFSLLSVFTSIYKKYEVYKLYETKRRLEKYEAKDATLKEVDVILDRLKSDPDFAKRVRSKANRKS